MARLETSELDVAHLQTSQLDVATKYAASAWKGQPAQSKNWHVPQARMRSDED